MGSAPQEVTSHMPGPSKRRDRRRAKTVNPFVPTGEPKGGLRFSVQRTVLTPK